jgi:hypothetical protein
MSRLLVAPAALVAALALTASAQADVTATQVSSPARTTHVLYRTDDAQAQTLAVAGVATGSGSVDIVCQAGPTVVHLADGVPVAANGTFAQPDVPLEPASGGYPWQPAMSCHLRALPAGSSPTAYDAFSGPELDVSKYGRYELANTGNNDGKLTDYYLYAAGQGYGASISAFGSCGLLSVIQDRSTLEPLGWGAGCAGSAPDANDRVDVAIDGRPVYSPGAIDGGNTGSGVQGNEPFPTLAEPVVRFDAASGDVSVDETSPFVKCADPGDVFPPLPWICTGFTPIPVQLHRTVSVVGDGQLVRTVDRWSSTDGHAHDLDLSILEQSCFTHGNDCSERFRYRFPGEAGYTENADGATKPAADALKPIFIQDAADHSAGGAIVVPGQRTDGAAFFAQDAFGLKYARTIPAKGTLTLTHYYATVSAADGPVEKGLELLKPLLPAAPKPAPKPAPHPGGGGTVTPAGPTFAHAGHVRVRRSGRTFAVVARDRVHCAAACVLEVRGRRIAPKTTAVAAGETAKVRFRLKRGAARALLRHGRLRLTVKLSAAGVTATRRLTLRVRA